MRRELRNHTIISTAEAPDTLQRLTPLLWLAAIAASVATLLLNDHGLHSSSITGQQEKDHPEQENPEVDHFRSDANVAEISLRGLVDFVYGKQGLVIDARPEPFYDIGHIPGALTLPKSELESAYRNLASKLRDARHRPIVIYCSGFICDDSLAVAKALSDKGYSRVMIFRGGWDEWSGQGLPAEVTK